MVFFARVFYGKKIISLRMSYFIENVADNLHVDEISSINYTVFVESLDKFFRLHRSMQSK